jgi:DNA polymerase III subunit beta
MRLTIERAALFRALNHVQSVPERRNTLPILANVLLDAREGALRLVATDLDIEITDSAPAMVESAGSTTAPAGLLHDIVRKLPDSATVTLDLGNSDGRLTVAAGRSRFQLSVLPADDFPMVRVDGLETVFKVRRPELARLIDRTKFAISTEETRYYLNGIFLHVAKAHDGPVLRAVATDGHRLALADIVAPDGAEGMAGVIVPRKTVDQLRRLLDGGPEDVEIAVSPTKIRFRVGDAILTSKQIDGSYPDYDRVIPRENQRLLRVENKTFAQAVDRVAIVSADRTRQVKLAVEGDRMTLTVNNPDSGQAQEELHCAYDSDAMEIGFNSRFLTDVANQIQGEEALLELADGSSPTLIRDSGDLNALYVLMPLRV